MSDSRPTCPRCHSHHIVKNGRIHNKKPKFQCQDCQRQFVENPTKKVIDQEIKALIDRLLLEKIPLAGIARTAQVSETWIQDYINDKYVHVPRQVNVSDKPKGKLTVECDEVGAELSRMEHPRDNSRRVICRSQGKSAMDLACYR